MALITPHPGWSGLIKNLPPHIPISVTNPVNSLQSLSPQGIVITDQSKVDSAINQYLNTVRLYNYHDFSQKNSPSKNYILPVEHLTASNTVNTQSTLESQSSVIDQPSSTMMTTITSPRDISSSSFLNPLDPVPITQPHSSSSDRPTLSEQSSNNPSPVNPSESSSESHPVTKPLSIDTKSELVFDDPNGWKKISQRWQNSVLQLRTTSGRFNPFRPYQTPDDQRSRGTGFIIDIDHGFVLTNAHVVKNSFAISARSPRLGDTDIPIKLFSLSVERDVALCQLTIEGIQMMTSGLTNPTDLNVKFGDDLFVQATDEVLTIGFPLGDEIKFTTGVISGFYRGSENNNDKYVEDIMERDPTYLQITAALNRGNSGGPLFDRTGRVIGINAAGFLFAQNVGYSIRSRIVLSLLPSLYQQNGPVQIPNFGFKWSPTNQALFQANQNLVKDTDESNQACFRPMIPNLKSNNYNGGIYVRKVFPDSVLLNKVNKQDLPGKPKGSVLIAISYYDIFLTNDQTFDPTSYQQNFQSIGVDNDQLITAQLDYHGSVNLYKSNGQLLIDRKLKLAEMIDLLPYPTLLRLTYFTAGKRCPFSMVQIKYEPSSVFRLQYAQPIIQPFDFEILAGLCIMELLADHTNDTERLSCYYLTDHNRYKHQLIICQVFPNTEASQTNSINQGDLLKTINGHKIKTLTQLREEIKKANERPFLTFYTKSKKPLVIATEVAKKDDQQVLETFKILPRYNSLNLER